MFDFGVDDINPDKSLDHPNKQNLASSKLSLAFLVGPFKIAVIGLPLSFSKKTYR